jgi:large subunit ribosomal protein L22
MADYKYAYNGPEEGTAKAVLRGFAISTKTSIEMSKYLKGKSTKAAKAILERIIKQEEALPFTRFTNGLGHKKGMSAGRYPEKASKAFLQLIASAEANAHQAGLGDELKIIHLLAHQASRSYHYGRQRRRQTKASHVEIVVKETAPKKKAVKKAVQHQEVLDVTHETVHEHTHNHDAHEHHHVAPEAPLSEKKEKKVVSEKSEAPKKKAKPSQESKETA